MAHDATQTSNVGGNQWSCSVCTFLNTQYNAECKICVVGQRPVGFNDDLKVSSHNDNLIQNYYKQKQSATLTNTIKIVFTLIKLPLFCVSSLINLVNKNIVRLSLMSSDPMSQFLIFGYIRNNCNKFIPNDIKLICLSYYTALPIKYEIELSKTSKIFDLKKNISEITMIPSNKLILCDIWQNRIYNILEDYHSIDPKIKAICYEVPTDNEIMKIFNIQSSGIDYKLISINHRITIDDTHYSHRHQQFIGIPLLIKVPTSPFNANMLKCVVNKLIEPYFQNFNEWNITNSNKSKDLLDELPYRIIVLDKLGRNCGLCSFLSMCSGCNIDDIKMLTLGIYPINIAIDWKQGSRNCFDHNAFTPNTCIKIEFKENDNPQETLNRIKNMFGDESDTDSDK